MNMLYGKWAVCWSEEEKIGGAFDRWRENRMSKILIRSNVGSYTETTCFYFNNVMYNEIALFHFRYAS